MRAVILGVILAFSAVAAQAAVYKWVDQNGKTHYSDKPVQNAEKLKVPGDKKAEPGQQPDSDKPKLDEAATAQVRAQKCEQAQSRLAEYQNSSSLVSKDEFGAQRTLSPEEQVQAIVEMQKNVDSFCAGQPEQTQAETASP
ncbi:MAG: DUF4124 domain-containing protein [Nevskiales bacterium]